MAHHVVQADGGPEFEGLLQIVLVSVLNAIWTERQPQKDVAPSSETMAQSEPSSHCGTSSVSTSGESEKAKLYTVSCILYILYAVHVFVEQASVSGSHSW